MGNAAGVGGVLAALFRPGLIVPHFVSPGGWIKVCARKKGVGAEYLEMKSKDINSLDWQALHRRGVSHVLFDKDNCLTLPHAPDVIDELRPGWEGCRKTFEREHVLIVSNSAGSSDDPLSIEVCLPPPCSSLYLKTNSSDAIFLNRLSNWPRHWIRTFWRIPIRSPRPGVRSKSSTCFRHHWRVAQVLGTFLWSVIESRPISSLLLASIATSDRGAESNARSES